jgi:hypothetical protein
MNAYQFENLDRIDIAMQLANRVTGLGEFSSKGQLFTLDSFMKITEVDDIFVLLFTRYTSVDHVLILTKNGLGYILGVFFTNTSGHPAGKVQGLSQN